MNSDQSARFRHAYMAALATFSHDARGHLEATLKVMREADYGEAHDDMEDFAREAFLYNIREFYDLHAGLMRDMKAAVNLTKSILEGGRETDPR
jgi:hypothetical protein